MAPWMLSSGLARGDRRPGDSMIIMKIAYRGAGGPILDLDAAEFGLYRERLPTGSMRHSGPARRQY